MSGIFRQFAIRLKQQIERHLAWWVLGVLVLLSFSVPMIVPVYFREDDVVYLDWARTHSWVEGLRSSQAVLFGMFRPVQNLTWWGLYHFAGLNPYPYQVVILFTYLAAMAAFFAFIRTTLSVRTAWTSIAVYGVAFYFLMYIVFWFSDFTYTLELMFAHGALWLFALAVKHNTRRHLTGAVILFCVAVAAKEPAALIVPLVCFQVLAVHWTRLGRPSRIRLGVTAGLMLVAGLAWIVANASVASRQGIPWAQGAESVSVFIRQRWSFYAAILTAFPTILVWVAILFPLVHRVVARFLPHALSAMVLSMGVSVVMTGLLKMTPDVALLVLLGAFAVLIVWRHPAGIGALWAAPAILGIMTLDYTVRTYLVEASFGLALAGGAAISLLLDLVVPRLALRPGRQLRRNLVIVASGGLVLAIGMAPLLLGKWRALQALSANRQNFAGAISYLAHPGAGVPAPLLIVDYNDMGLVYERDILPLGDGEKALRQKTMTSLSLQAFLPASSMPVHNLEWWGAHPEIREASLLTMNVREEAFLDGQPLQKSILREWAHGGARARLYRIIRP